MNIILAFLISLNAIKANKIRSFLTTLGIIIGVAAVISLVAVTEGAKNMIENQLTTLGGNSLIVNPGRETKGGKRSFAGEIKPLTAKDADSIRTIPVVRYVSEIVDTTKTVSTAGISWFTTIVGVSPDFVYINDWYPSRGTFFNYNDIKKASLVCVIGQTIASTLFDNDDPVGKNIRIGNHTYKVIGVMTSLGQTPSGKDQDDIILAPYTTVQKRIVGESNLDNISVAVGTTEQIEFAKSRIIELLSKNHDIEEGEDPDFNVKTQLIHIERILMVSRILSILLASIASISLVVGGIGIMNIMLVSVGERTKEIGIRMAVGAREKDILVQFLIEAITLSLIGGLIGVTFGGMISEIASYITGWPISISLYSVIIAFIFSALVGIFFGIYPARKASRLNPIEALRYE